MIINFYNNYFYYLSSKIFKYDDNNYIFFNNDYLKFKMIICFKKIILSSIINIYDDKI